MSKAVKVVGAVVVSGLGVLFMGFTSGASLVWAGKLATYGFAMRDKNEREWTAVLEVEDE